MKKCFSLVAFACTAFAAAAQTGTLVTAETINHGGIARYFHCYVPNNLTASPPLVILLHGGGRSYNQIINSTSASREWLAIADDEGFLVVIPNGIDPETGLADTENQNWNDCRADDAALSTGADDVGFVNALINWSSTNFAIDTDRVYATGASNGGMMSYRLARELGNRIAAIAVFIANEPAVSECNGFLYVVPTFICNGNAETFYMPWDGGDVFSASRGTVRSALETRDIWIARTGVSPTPTQVVNYPNVDLFDGGTVSSALYTGGLEGAEVMFYTVDGGGHTIPSINYPLSLAALLVVGPQNNDIEGAREAWAFLSRHTLGSAHPPGLPISKAALLVILAGLALSGTARISMLASARTT